MERLTDEEMERLERLARNLRHKAEVMGDSAAHFVNHPHPEDYDGELLQTYVENATRAGCDAYVVELAVAEVRELRARGWVSVEERLPERDMDVLVFDAGRRSALIAGITRREGGDFWWAPYIGWLNHLTHWQPLPEAPGAAGGSEQS